MLIGAVRKHLAGSVGFLSIGPCNESLAAPSRPSPKQAAHSEQGLCWSCSVFMEEIAILALQQVELPWIEPGLLAESI